MGLLFGCRIGTTAARNSRPMAKKTTALNDNQFLELLQKVLPRATRDPRLANAIYEHVAKEIRLVNNVKTFERFCTEGSLPDLEPETVKGFQAQLAGNFGAENVVVKPAEKGDALEVEIALPDRKITNKLKVQPPGTEEEEELKPKFVPFPVALPEDPDLLWILARREDFPPDEAARALEKIESEFWETKAGLKLQKDRVEKSFAEFVNHVPAAALTDSGLKRHYKEPEPRRVLHRSPAARPAGRGKPAEDEAIEVAAPKRPAAAKRAAATPPAST